MDKVTFLVRIFALGGVDVETKALAALVGASLQSLASDFAPVANHIMDAKINTLANGIPASLQNLDLSFAYCSQITDAGVTALVSSLPAGLQTLKINFKECKELTGEHLGLPLVAAEHGLILRWLQSHQGDYSFEGIARRSEDAQDQLHALCGAHRREHVALPIIAAAHDLRLLWYQS